MGNILEFRGLTRTLDDFANWQEWLACLAKTSLAACVVQDDPDLTLLGANKQFYYIYNCSPEEMRYKYGERLGALLNGDSAKTFATMAKNWDSADKTPHHLTLSFKRHGQDAWAQTEIIASQTDTGRIFCCTAHDVTEYEQELRIMRAHDETLRQVATQASLDYFEYDFISREARIFGKPSILPESIFDEQGQCANFAHTLITKEVVFPEYKQDLEEILHPSRKHSEKTMREMELMGQNNSRMWVRLSLVQKQDALGNEHVAAGILENITQQKEASRNYLTETQFLQALLTEKDAYGQVDVTANRINRVGGMWNLYNEIISKVTYTELITKFINKIVHPEDRKQYLEIMQRDNFIASLNNGIDRLACEFRRIVDQNKLMWMKLSVNLFRDPLTNHVFALLSIKNIDEKKKQELMLLSDSRLDQLTSVQSKMAAEAQICEYLSQAGQHEQSALIILDVDDFKQINDTCGHREGDNMLVRLATLLRRTFRKHDVIGRFGGGVFVLMLKNVGSQRRVAERLEALYALLGETDESGPIACSAGVAMACGNAHYKTLFQQADLALFQAKEQGKNRFVICSDTSKPETLQQESAPLLHAQEAVARADKMPALLMPYATAIADPSNQSAFDAFIGDQGDIAYLIDPATFDLICGNKAFYDRIGLSETQCRGMKCYEAMHRRDTPCPFCSKANWSSDKFYLWRNLNLALEQEFLIKNKLVSWRGQEAVLALAIDISNDKSIVDSMENGATEVHSILGGVQRMTEARSLTEAMTCALEAAGSFFRADTVRLWQLNEEKLYDCAYAWRRKNRETKFAPANLREISAWINSQKWEQPLMLENPEAMLCYSYNMYLYMKNTNIQNQRWVAIKENNEMLGFISIDNISSNFQNVAFLESFSVFIASELKKRSLMEEALYSGRHDDLTDLLSRKSFEEYMGAYRPDQIVCVGALMANFNNLKGINSSCGFQTGNYFIKQFADMLRQAFDSQMMFRLNGDEFLVIAPEVTRNDLDTKILALEELIKENGGFTVSMGSAWDDVENDLSVLIDQATQAMRVNKKRHYDSAASFTGAQRRRMLSDLIAALENREYEVFLQPKVELAHGTVVGAEALIRYHDKELGIVPPSQFIDMLEKNNLIRYIDLFAFEEVCRILEQWKKLGLFLPVVSVNFSRLTLLERDILASVESITSRYDVCKKYIEIEITESMASMGKSVLYQAAGDLYKAGYAISLDDFGTKYTNLAILTELDFSILKVDKSLIAMLGSRTNNQIIMKNIIYMCKDLGISVLAEGIETKLQEHILRDMECHMGQGYLYGRPMPIDEFAKKYVQFDQRM